MQTYTKEIPRDVAITSVLLAFFADTKILNLIILAAMPSLSGVMAIMYCLVIIALLYMGLVRQKKSVFSFRFSHMAICALCSFWYIGTTAFVNQPSVTLPFFLIFTVAAFLIPGIIQIEVRTFLLALIILPSFGILYMNQIFLIETVEGGIVSMGTCYAFLVPILANFVYLKFYFKKETIYYKIIMLLFSFINLLYLLQISMFGSRGPILCLLLLLISFFLVTIKTDGHILFHKKRFVIIISLGFFVSKFFIPILQAISDFLLNFDVSLNVVDKFLLLEEQGDVSNGRDVIEHISWESIMNAPFFGYGTAQFKNNTGFVYPHNFIVQMMYDGGLFLCSFVFIPLVNTALRKLYHISSEEFICLLLLFFVSVPGALFSGDLWQSSTLWIFFGFILAKSSVFEFKTE